MKFLFLLLTSLLITSCQTTPELSDAQKRSMQVKIWQNVNYDSVFRATKTVMQDEGYIIKNQDMQGGLITASVQKSQSAGSQVLLALGGNSNYRTGSEFEISCNMEAINATTVETRLAVQRKDNYSLGASAGEVILDPEMYKSFYDKLRVEIARRSAMGK